MHRQCPQCVAKLDWPASNTLFCSNSIAALDETISTKSLFGLYSSEPTTDGPVTMFDVIIISNVNDAHDRTESIAIHGSKSHGDPLYLLRYMAVDPMEL